MLLVAARLSVCAMLLAPGLAGAIETSAGDGVLLTLRETIARTLEHNPDLQAFPPARRRAEAERLQAGFRPNPELGLILENFAGTGEARGTTSLETTLSLSQLIELGGKRASRVDLANAEFASVEADYTIARLDALAEATRRYIDVAQSQEEVQLADRAVALAEGVAAAVERRIRAGAASTAERNRAAVSLIRTRLDAQRARTELDARRIALAAIWGAETADFVSVRGDLRDIAPLADLGPLIDQLRNSPAFARFTAERRLREAELRLARAERVPNLSVGIGVRRFEATDDYGLVASLSLPLPVFNRNQGGIAAATERIAETYAGRNAEYLHSRSVLYGLYQQAVQARTRATSLGDEAVPQAEQALVLTERGFLNGRFLFLELADAQRQVLELRGQAITAFADAHRLDAEIERLTGQPIVVTQAPPSGDSR